jgi:hypothetical protein
MTLMTFYGGVVRRPVYSVCVCMSSECPTQLFITAICPMLDRDRARIIAVVYIQS